jgi:DNA-binding GntR family transcriptional regulator
VSELSAFREAFHLMQRVVTRMAALRWTESDLASLRAAQKAYEDSAASNNAIRRLELDQAFRGLDVNVDRVMRFLAVLLTAFAFSQSARSRHRNSMPSKHVAYCW